MDKRLKDIETSNEVLNHNNPAWKEEISWLIRLAKENNKLHGENDVLYQEKQRYRQAFKNIDNAFNNDQLNDEMFIAEVEDILISLKKGEEE